jgi:hypothetical protein
VEGKVRKKENDLRQTVHAQGLERKMFEESWKRPD